MQAPLVLAAWSMSAGMCCTAGYCPITAHHHPMSSEPAHGMNCGHDMSGGMAGCKMDCCHDSEQPTITAAIFVMPPVDVMATTISVVGAVEAPKHTEFLRSTEPASPPPRNTASTL